MSFVTKIDYSNNRQIKQFSKTNTELSGSTEFGVAFSALTSGVDETSVVTTSTLINIVSTFSGNSSVTAIDFGDSRMVIASNSLDPITNLNSGTTQIALGYVGDTFTELDQNIVYLTYTGATFDFTVTSIESDGLSGWTGTAISNGVEFLSGTSLDYKERTIWVDVKGITRTEKLIIERLPIKDNTLQSVLGRQADGDVVEVDLTEIKSLYRATYAEYQVIIANNGLLVGNKYILTDYKTVYQIANSSTSPIIERFIVSGNAGGWTYFANPVPVESLQQGDTVTISVAPPGSGRFVGQTAVCTVWFNTAYMQFSPTLLTAGIEIETRKIRNANIPNDTIILDTYGNVVMQPTGVLNTQVHNGLPYMNMTAVENYPPQVEEIILVAIAENQFSIEAESLTHKGDLLLYYFDNNEIYDENNVLIGTRNGLIQKREAFDLRISIDKDWRTQRYRRWKMDNDNWTGYTLNRDVYKVSGRNVCTIVNIVNDNHKYVCPKPYNKDFYHDFYTTNNTDPFLSGETWAYSVLAGERMINDFATEYTKTISLPFSGLTQAKDFYIFPITEGVITPLLSAFKVGSLSNTICRTESSRYGTSANIYINTPASYMYNSSFMTGPNIRASRGTINDVTLIDATALTIGGHGDIYNCHFFNYGSVTTDCLLRNCTFGGSRDGINDYFEYYFDSGSNILNSIFGCIRGEDTHFNSFIANKFLYKYKVSGNNVVTGNVYLTSLQRNGDLWGSEIHLNNWTNPNPLKTTNAGASRYGYLYDLGSAYLQDKITKNFNAKRNLIYEDINNIGVISLVTVSTLQ